MTQSLDFDYNQDTGNYHLILGGEDQGPVDEDDLRDSANELYLHFHWFKDHPEEGDQSLVNVEPEDGPDTNAVELIEASEVSEEQSDGLSHEEVDEEIEKVFDEIEDELEDEEPE